MVWFYSWPVWLSLPVFAILFLAGSWAILIVVRPWVRQAAANREEWDRVLGYSMSSYGLFYGILLALVAVAVYSNFSSVRDVVLAETSSLASLYRDVSGLSQPTAGHLQSLLRSYTQHVISVDWPEQAAGIVPNEGTAQVSSFQRILFSYQPTGAGQQALYVQTIQSFNTFVADRRTRINETSLAIPGLLWAVIWVGALVNAVLISLIEVNNLRVHLVMSGLIAIYVGLLIYVTASLDHPYAGTVSITPEDFRTLLQQVMSGP